MTPTTDTRDNSRRALSILARSLFRQMRDQGYSPEQVIALALPATDWRQITDLLPAVVNKRLQAKLAG